MGQMKRKTFRGAPDASFADLTGERLQKFMTRLQQKQKTSHHLSGGGSSSPADGGSSASAVACVSAKAKTVIKMTPRPKMSKAARRALILRYRLAALDVISGIADMFAKQRRHEFQPRLNE